jgi:uncharacterized protein
MEHNWTVIGYNILALIFVFGALGLLREYRASSPVAGIVILALCLIVLSILGAVLSPIDFFGKLQLLAWVVFFHFTIFFLGAAFLTFRRNRGVALVCVLVAAVLVLVGIYAFLVEPHRLEITRMTIPAAKLRVPVRVAIVADIQAEEPGPYEEAALRAVQAETPDLILLLGDYIQVKGRDRYTAACTAFNKMLHEVNLQAPLGVHAVRGNVDRSNIRHSYFAGLPVNTFENTRTVDLGPLALTGLAWEDSLETKLLVGPQEKFHVVFGHHPNFSLGRVDANLLLAGHTHGGQVRLPLLGPILTLSRVPRSWASGMTTLGPERTLIVSRGIGMERVNAPQMRFLCPPEIVIVDLTPGL